MSMKKSAVQDTVAPTRRSETLPPARDGAADRYVPALGFSWLTGLYDPVIALTTRERRFKQRLLEQAEITGDMRVLDLACGTGTLSVRLKQMAPGADVVGFDGDPGVLERARRKAAAAGIALQLDHGMSFEMPYPDGSFDRVLSTLFFHHLSRENKKRTLAEAIRILKPGGRLHVADWGRPANAIERLLFYPVQLLDGFPNTRDNVEGRLPELMSAAGFADATVLGGLTTMFGRLAFYRVRKPAH